MVQHSQMIIDGGVRPDRLVQLTHVIHLLLHLTVALSAEYLSGFLLLEFLVFVEVLMRGLQNFIFGDEICPQFVVFAVGCHEL